MMPPEMLSSAEASVHVNARRLLKIEHVDEPQPADQVATESSERGVPLRVGVVISLQISLTANWQSGLSMLR